MRDIDDDAQGIAAPHHIRAEIRQAPVYRRLRLDVAQLVYAVVRELQVPQLVHAVRFIHALQPAFQKVGALRRNDRARPGRPPRGQRSRVGHHLHLLSLHQLMCAGEFGHAKRVELALRRGSPGLEARAIGRHARDDGVRHDRQADHVHAAGAHRRGQRKKGPVRADGGIARHDHAAGMAVHIDGQRGGEGFPRGDVFDGLRAGRSLRRGVAGKAFRCTGG